jgi:hypothetical protein
VWGQKRKEKGTYFSFFDWVRSGVGLTFWAPIGVSDWSTKKKKKRKKKGTIRHPKSIIHISSIHFP